MKQIESYGGKKKNIGCLGCAMEKKEIDYTKGNIIKTKYFDLHQDYEVPIEAFFIISSRRHFSSVAELTDDEQKEFFKLVKKTREGMKKALNIKEIVIFQNEASDHHFHIWLFPFHGWMRQKSFKKKIYDLWPIIEYARANMKTKENIEKVDESLKKMKEYMKSFK